jgi:hypothetical protein
LPTGLQEIQYNQPDGTTKFTTTHDEEESQQQRLQSRIKRRILRIHSTTSATSKGSEHRRSATKIVMTSLLTKSHFLPRPLSKLILRISSEPSRYVQTESQKVDATEDSDDDTASLGSDFEVRHKRRHESNNNEINNRDDKIASDEDASQSSSILEDEHRDHYDTWEVLRDEYAEEYGFSYDPMRNLDDEMDDDADVTNRFRILGTSAGDKLAQPHVLSPPLMDSLMTILLERIQRTNYWLRYSLVRDGASIETMKQYCSLCKDIIIAIETFLDVIQVVLGKIIILFMDIYHPLFGK